MKKTVKFVIEDGRTLDTTAVGTVHCRELAWRYNSRLFSVRDENKGESSDKYYCSDITSRTGWRQISEADFDEYAAELKEENEAH